MTSNFPFPRTADYYTNLDLFFAFLSRRSKEIDKQQCNPSHFWTCTLGRLFPLFSIMYIILCLADLSIHNDKSLPLTSSKIKQFSLQVFSNVHVIIKWSLRTCWTLLCHALLVRRKHFCGHIYCPYFADFLKNASKTPLSVPASQICITVFKA